MKTMDTHELEILFGGAPDQRSSLAYDISYGFGALAGAIWSVLMQPVPTNWHSGTLGLS